jgi:WS/DGAT/MGAT family acyltransferase
VLAVVTGALRSFLISRGVRTEGLELRALVPVSVRTAGEHAEMGNRIVAIRGALPVYIADPVERLTYISTAMAGLKESKQAMGAKVIAGAQNFAPPTILAQASRLNFSTRLFNLIVTNIPGPQFPLYVLGRELLHAYPVAFLPAGHALAIAIMSYNGEMNFSLLGDFDTLPDIDQLGRNVAAELATLVAVASERSPATRKRRTPGTKGRPSRSPADSDDGADAKRRRAAVRSADGRPISRSRAKRRTRA